MKSLPPIPYITYHTILIVYRTRLHTLVCLAIFMHIYFRRSFSGVETVSYSADLRSESNVLEVS